MIRDRNNGCYIEIAYQFSILGEVQSCNPIPGGLINKSYLVITSTSKYVLQQINDSIFPDIDLLMNNIMAVSHHLCKTGHLGIKVVKTKKGENYLRTNTGHYWRMYLYIDNTYSIDTIRTHSDAKEYGSAIGNFLIQMDGFNETLVNDPIPNFHDTCSRYFDFISSIENDCKNRAVLVKDEIEYVYHQWEFIDSMAKVISNDSIPSAIIHNDVRLNNVLFSAKSHEAVCLIDYDTIMKGKRILDFCDGFRFAVTYDTLEYESQSRVKIDLDLARSYIRGYWGTCGGVMNDEESSVAISCSRLLTLENGIRLLTDYLNGDIYFYVEYPGQNLIRWQRHRQLLNAIDTHQSILEHIIKGVQYDIY